MVHHKASPNCKRNCNRVDAEHQLPFELISLNITKMHPSKLSTRVSYLNLVSIVCKVGYTLLRFSSGTYNRLTGSEIHLLSSYQVPPWYPKFLQYQYSRRSGEGSLTCHSPKWSMRVCGPQWSPRSEKYSASKKSAHQIGLGIHLPRLLTIFH